MDIWQVAILGGVVVLTAYCVIHNRSERRRKEQLIRKLFVYAYQTKDLLVHLSAMQDHHQEVQKRLPSVSPDELKRIEFALVKKSMALSILSCLRLEKGFDFIRSNPFANVALQKEDLAAVNNILETAYGPEHKLYHVDLNDAMISPLLAVLKELADSGSR